MYVLPIHITSDCVFNGKKGNYDENHNTNAEDHYGISKAKADQLLIKNSGVIILRTSTIGHEIKTKKGLLEWFLSQKKNVNGFKKAYFSGPTTLELSKIIYAYIIKKKVIKSGLYNIAGPKINKYKLLQIIKKIYNKNIIIKKEHKFKIDRSLNAALELKFIFLDSRTYLSLICLFSQLFVFLFFATYKL